MLHDMYKKLQNKCKIKTCKINVAEKAVKKKIETMAAADVIATRDKFWRSILPETSRNKFVASHTKTSLHRTVANWTVFPPPERFIKIQTHPSYVVANASVRERCELAINMSDAGAGSIQHLAAALPNLKGSAALVKHSKHAKPLLLRQPGLIGIRVARSSTSHIICGQR